MTIRVAHDRDKNKTIEINIPEYETVVNIKDLISDNMKDNCPESLHHFNLIYRNIILDEDNLIKFYRVFPNDVIWAGRLKYFLTDDDIIVELFLVGWATNLMHLVMKKRDPISRIKSIIERIIGEHGRIDIWNAHNGDSLEDTAIIGEIDWIDGYQKIICSWCEEMELTFEQCRTMHDQYLIQTYYWEYDWMRFCKRDPILWSSLKMEKAHFKENISQKLLNDSRLVENLSDIPISIRNSKLFCCLNVANCILPIFEHYWTGGSTVRIRRHSGNGFMEEFPSILVASFLKYFDFFQTDISIKSIGYILREVSHWEFDGDKKGFLDYFLLLPRTHYINVDESPNQKDWFTNIGVYKPNCISRSFRIPRNVKTILQAKKAISWQTGIPLNELFPIKKGSKGEPKDEDYLEETRWGYFFKVVSRPNRITENKQLRRLGYGTLCLSKDVTKSKLAPKITDEFLYRKNNFCKSDLKYLFCNLNRGIDNTFYEGSLHSYLEKRNRLPEAEIARIFHELLLQIEKLHSKNIIHRDIKSENVMVCRNPYSPLIGYQTVPTYYSKILEYKTPEIHFCEPHSTKKDIWSLGVMVIEMLTGKRPVMNYKFAEFVRKSGKVPVEANFEISDELQEFIDLSMKPNPNDRATVNQLLNSKFILKYPDKGITHNEFYRLHEEYETNLDEAYGLKSIFEYGN